MHGISLLSAIMKNAGMQVNVGQFGSIPKVLTEEQMFRHDFMDGGQKSKVFTLCLVYSEHFMHTHSFIYQKKNNYWELR